MRIHHLNRISSCPLGGRLMDGRTRSIVARGRLCNHCLPVEGARGLTLVDTGFGLHDVADPRGRPSRFFLALLSPAFREEMTAVRQIRRAFARPVRATKGAAQLPCRVGRTKTRLSSSAPTTVAEPSLCTSAARSFC